jgi:hypothetical protein
VGPSSPTASASPPQDRDSYALSKGPSSPILGGFGRESEYVEPMAKTQLWYRPIGMITSIAAGALSAMVFKRLWQPIMGEDTAPEAVDEGRTWTEVLVGAGLQGAVFGLVHALVERGGATAVRRLTGQWPAKA